MLIHQFNHFRCPLGNPSGFPAVRDQDFGKFHFPKESISIPIRIADKKIRSLRNFKPHLLKKKSIKIHLNPVTIMIGVSEIWFWRKRFGIRLRFIVYDH